MKTFTTTQKREIPNYIRNCVQNLEYSSGVYLLLVRVEKGVWIEVGSLMKTHFPPGFYIYIGSAQNSLIKRLLRHLKRHKRLHWHIDYLLENPFAEIIGVYTIRAGKEYECRIARILSKKYESVMGFGCSDCSCRSHLFRLHPYSRFL